MTIGSQPLTNGAKTGRDIESPEKALASLLAQSFEKSRQLRALLDFTRPVRFQKRLLQRLGGRGRRERSARLLRQLAESSDWDEKVFGPREQQHQIADLLAPTRGRPPKKFGRDFVERIDAWRTAVEATRHMRIGLRIRTHKIADDRRVKGAISIKQAIEEYFASEVGRGPTKREIGVAQAVYSRMKRKPR